MLYPLSYEGGALWENVWEIAAMSARSHTIFRWSCAVRCPWRLRTAASVAGEARWWLRCRRLSQGLLAVARATELFAQA